MASFFIPLEVRDGVGLEIGRRYGFDDWGSDGRGGLGEVFHVRDCELAGTLFGVDVCLKRLKENFDIASISELLRDPRPGSRRARLLDAIRTEYAMYVGLAGAHGHAPRAYALGAVVRGDNPDSAQYALLMDWVGGDGVMTLKTALPILSGDSRGGGLSAPAAARVGTKLCEALDQVHRENITHRDLSPKNIMVRLSRDASSVEHVTFIDFGQSTTPAEDETVSQERRFASKPFGAPEMFSLSADPYYHLRNKEMVDIWSVGALLYYLRTGENPSICSWDEAAGLASLAKAKRGGLQLPASCATAEDDVLQDVIEMCCCDNPNKRRRLGEIQEVLESLASVLDEDETPDAEDETPDVEDEAPGIGVQGLVDSEPAFPEPDAGKTEWLDFLARWDRYWNPRGRYSDDPYDVDGYETDYSVECELVEGLKRLYGYKGIADAADLSDGMYHISMAIGPGSELAVDCLVGYYNAFDATLAEPPIPCDYGNTAEESFVYPSRRILRRIWDSYLRCLGRRPQKTAPDSSVSATQLLTTGIRLVLGMCWEGKDRLDVAEVRRRLSAASACIAAARRLGDESAAMWERWGSASGLVNTWGIYREHRDFGWLSEWREREWDDTICAHELDKWFDAGRAEFERACGAEAAKHVSEARKLLEKELPGAGVSHRSSGPTGQAITTHGMSDLERANSVRDTDPKQAFELYQRAAQAGDLSAMRELALCYYYGTGTERNLKTCANMLRAAAMAGNAFASFSLLDLGLEKMDADELARLEDRRRPHTAEEEYRLGVQYELYGGGDPFYPYCRAAFVGNFRAKDALEARGERLPDMEAIRKRAASGYVDSIRAYQLLDGELTSPMAAILASSGYRDSSSADTARRVAAHAPNWPSAQPPARPNDPMFG